MEMAYHRRLITEAKKSPHPQHRHSTLIIKGGAIIASGYNHDEKHSETVALGKLWPGDAKGTTIINLRLKRDGSVANSKPCCKCLARLKAEKVGKILYTDEEGIIKKLDFLRER